MKNSLMEGFNKYFDKKLNEELKLYTEIGEYKPWSGAEDTWYKIVDADMVSNLEDYLEEMYPEGLSITALNDLLWFDGEDVLSALGLSDYPKTVEVEVKNIVYSNYDGDYDLSDKDGFPTEMKVEVTVYSEDDDIRDLVRDEIYSNSNVTLASDIEDFEYELDECIKEKCEKNESSEIDKIDADSDDKKEKLKKFIAKKIDDIDADRDDKKKNLKESDKPAATSIEDAQKWVDYDMKKYGKISGRTNRLVRKAGFQIVKDTYGDYEVIAGKYDESVGSEKYYFVEDDSWGQRGTYIETIYLTREEADKVKKTRMYNGKRGFFTKDYEDALYYTQD